MASNADLILPDGTNTVNEMVLDAIVRHQIYLLRLDGTYRNHVLDLLNKSEEDLARLLREELPKLGAGTAPRQLQRAEAIFRTIESVRRPVWTDIDGYLRSEFTALTLAQPEFMATVYQTVSPVVISMALPAPELLEALVQTQPFAGKDLTTWMDGLRRTDVERISEAIRMGMLQGETTDNIVRRVLGTRQFGGRDGITIRTRRDARTLVRTGTIAFSNMANRLFYQANSDIFSEEQFVATLDSRTTQVCMSLDGNTYPIGVGPIPPVHFNCRSIRVAFFGKDFITTRPFKTSTERSLVRQYASANNLGTVSSRAALPRGHRGAFDTWARGEVRRLTGNVPSRVTYTDFLRRQSVAFQNETLGVSRGVLFRKGGLRLDQFVEPDGTPYTLRELAQRHRDAFVAAGLSLD